MKKILPIISIIIIVCLYQCLSFVQYLRNPNDTTIPSVVKITQSFVQICTPDSLGKIWLLDDLMATGYRHLLGMGIGIIISLVLGLCMGWFRIVENLLLVPLSFFAKIPPTAMLAVFFVLFGHETKMFVAMIAFGILPSLTQSIYQSVKFDVPEEFINKAYTLGASHCEVILNVILNMILPRLIEFVRLSVGPAMVYLIAAEWMSADVGFGYRLRMQSRLLNMSVVYDYLIVLGFLGFWMDWSLTCIRIKTCPWFSNA